MKKLMMCAVLALSFAAQAGPGDVGSVIQASYDVPQELQVLIPAGGDQVLMKGVTKDNKKCTVGVSQSAFGFSIGLEVTDANGQMDSRRLGKFQIGLGHHFSSKDVTKNPMQFVVLKKADSGLESDSRETVYVKRSASRILSIQVVNEESGFFGGMKVKVNEICKF